MREALICEPLRTPVGRFGGMFRDVPVTELATTVIRAGNANMFLSPVFREAFVNTIGARLELYNTDGATGAAIGAGIGAGIYASARDAFRGLALITAQEVDRSKVDSYEEAYHLWKRILTNTLKNKSI